MRRWRDHQNLTIILRLVIIDIRDTSHQLHNSNRDLETILLAVAVLTEIRDNQVIISNITSSKGSTGKV